MGGCASQYDGEVGFVEGFHGGVVADDPRAAVIGRDVLSRGGTAADAATAIYFALSVTLPSSAGLGGGGVCLVHDAKTKSTQSLTFLPGTPAQPGGDRPAALPSNPRGFFALHAKYGKLRWEHIVSPAEKLARFGHPMSRAFAAELKATGSAALTDPGMRALFVGTSGALLGEGDTVTQVDLAGVLSSIRAQGPGDFYAGRTAARLVDAYQRAGAAISVADLRAHTPKWGGTVRLKRGNETVHFPPAPLGSAVAAALWRGLETGDAFANAEKTAKAQVMAQAARAAFTTTGAAGRLGNPSATTFVAADRHGSAIACAVSLNAPFGTGRIAQGTGIIPAALAGAGGRGPEALSVMMVLNHHVNEFFYASGASGGVAAPTAMLNVAAWALLSDKNLDSAMVAERVHHGASPDRAYYEPGLPEAMRATLGADAQATPTLGRVTALFCPRGIPPNPEKCGAMPDSRGAGLGLMSQEN